MVKKIMDEYQEYIHLSRYARWDRNLKRREVWEETVDRYVNFFSETNESIYPKEMIRNAILNLEVMPSMRCLMSAGKALERDNAAGFNCSAICIDTPRAFDEILYLLLVGCGVGFSVERQFINSLPIINEDFNDADTVISVHDSKIGWAKALRQLIALLYAGEVPKWDLSKIRGKGERLKIFGGRASGPEPLNDLFEFIIPIFRNAAGRKLNSLECHDIVCKIASIVVVGGVRRSATISLSNLSDDRMRNAKTGEWWTDNDQRKLANNSAAYTEKPEIEIFLKEWLSLIESKSGERGIFNRVAAKKKAEESGRRDPKFVLLTNPCAEILLPNCGFCNLSEVIIRPEDTLEILIQKIKIATIIGTFQSTLTNFRYLRKIWQKNAEEERLLGVSLTGIMDHPILSQNIDEARNMLKTMKQVCIDTNKEWAKKLGINQAAACTTVKPSGTVSELVNSSSGIHPRFSEYYIRTVRADNNDPLTQLMKDQNVPNEPDLSALDTTTIFSFPKKSPKNSVMRNDRSSIEQLEHYKMFRDYWTDHNVSITVYVRPDEWMSVGAWVFNNWDDIGGISFLPYSGGIYKQAPFTEINEEKYLEAVNNMPDIDFNKIGNYEKDDMTTSMQELACTGKDGCMI